MVAPFTKHQMFPPVQNTMGGMNLHTPPSIFQYIVGQQTTSQQPGEWSQMPQAPSMSIPWSVPSIQQPKVVDILRIQHQKKRKLVEAPDLLDTRQTKQFITEEKMTAHFKDLHISPNYQAQTSASPSTSTADPILRGLMDPDMDVANCQGKLGPTIILSEEIKKIQQEPILPNSLLSKLERPSMALVLWEPPSKHFRMLPTRDTPTPIPSTSDDNNNNNNNNNEDISDANQTLSNNSSVFEPMEL